MIWLYLNFGLLNKISVMTQSFKTFKTLVEETLFVGNPARIKEIECLDVH